MIVVDIPQFFLFIHQFSLLGGLRRSWSLLGRSWAVLGRSWIVLGRSWAVLGRSWGDLGVRLGHPLGSNIWFFEICFNAF